MISSLAGFLFCFGKFNFTNTLTDISCFSLQTNGIHSVVPIMLFRMFFEMILVPESWIICSRRRIFSSRLFILVSKIEVLVSIMFLSFMFSFCSKKIGISCIFRCVAIHFIQKFL